MAWFEKQRRARRSLDMERKALGASVEEIAARNEPVDDAWEKDENDAAVGKTAIIPPLLRLQSRPLPVVRLDAAKRQALAESGAYASAPVQSKRLGRSTKVHLQAVRPDQARESITDRLAAVSDARKEPARGESTASGIQYSLASQIERPGADRAAFTDSHPLGGSALIKQGQQEVMVPNPLVSERSVITVMLTGDPGPVVVHYISLHPCAGFTIHLSAPIAAPTPFNYIVWSF